MSLTFVLSTFWPPHSSTSTSMTLSRMSSLSLASILPPSSSLLASTKIVLARGNLGNFHLHVRLPPFLQELLWLCQFTSSAIFTASSPATVTHLVQVTKVSVNFSSAILS